MNAERLIQRQIELNCSTVNGWTDFAQHRGQIARHLQVAYDRLCQLRSLIGMPVGDPSFRVCVLGAGNCNDLALADLVLRFKEIVLVDLDRDAVEAGVLRQLGTLPASIQIIAPLDLTTVLDQGTSLARYESELKQRFDLVLSVGLLSQLIGVVLPDSGINEQALAEVQQVRRRHLRQLIEWSRGGTALLIWDLVSSVTAPELSRLPKSALPEAVKHYVNARNFFTGCNPAIVELELCDLLREVEDERKVHVTEPWIWQLQETRHYLVCGMMIGDP